MSASLFPSNFTLYNFHPEYQSSSQQKLSLVDVSCQFIVRNHALTVFALETVPTDLYESLLKAALKYSQDKSVEEIISRWPWHKLVLKKLMPPVFNSMKPLFNKLELTESARRGVKYTTSLVHTFMECLKKQKISQLCFLDLTGYPSVEVIINYLAAHVLLIYNEKSQREIITFYNEIAQNLPSDSRKLYSVEPLIPDKECTVCLDVTIESSEAHLELCRALSVVNKPKALLKVAVSQLDISAAGVAMVVVLLELIDPKFFRGVNLQYNGISNASLRLIAPCLQRFGDLVSLDISYNSLNLEDDETAKSFVSIFSSFSHLKNLNLSHIKLGSCLPDILSQLSNPLVMLRLSNCNLANADIICLHKSPVTRSLRELELSKNNLVPCIENLNLLISQLSPTLILLELEEVGLSSDNLLSCFEKSMLCQKLKFLNVSNNSSLCREAIMDSLVYFFVSPELEAVRISFPSDLSTDADNVTQSQQDFSSEIEKIIYCLCLRHKRMFFRIVFQS